MTSRPLAMLAALALGCAEPSHTATDTGAARTTPTAADAPPVQPCDSARTQIEMNACHADAARRAEAVEEARYDEARRALATVSDAAQAAALAASEAQWRAYRDAHCRAAAGLYAGGSMAGLIAADCRARLATGRARELEVTYGEWMAR